MTASKAIRALLAVFAAFLLAAGAAAPAMAQEKSAGFVSAAGDEMSAQTRHYNAVTSWQILYQCPMLGCNEGAAYPGQELAEICHMDANGYRWALVYNRANGHTGFINRDNLIHKRSLVHCNDVGSPGYFDTYEILYQCPQFFCNKGDAKAYDDLRGECYIPLDGWNWIWVYNKSNTHEGLIPVTYLPTLPVC